MEKSRLSGFPPIYPMVAGRNACCVGPPDEGVPGIASPCPWVSNTV